jgi:hypothetical protein
MNSANFPFFDEAVGSGRPRDQHIVRAPLARFLGGESPANFRAMTNIEIHRRAFVLQLSKAGELFKLSCKMTHDIARSAKPCAVLRRDASDVNSARSTSSSSSGEKRRPMTNPPQNEESPLSSSQFGVRRTRDSGHEIMIRLD